MKNINLVNQTQRKKKKNKTEQKKKNKNKTRRIVGGTPEYIYNKIIQKIDQINGYITEKKILEILEEMKQYTPNNWLELRLFILSKNLRNTYTKQISISDNVKKDIAAYFASIYSAKINTLRTQSRSDTPVTLSRSHTPVTQSRSHSSSDMFL